MKKVTVIVGEACSGKSRLAMELVKEFDPSEIILVDGKNSKKTDQRNLMNFSADKTKKLIEIPHHQTATGLPASTSLDGCPFHYCDKNPYCSGSCRYNKE